MAEKEKTEGLGISGFTLGVMSIAFAGIYGLLPGILGLIFCIVQQKSHKTKLGKIGIILNIIGLFLSIILFLLSYLGVMSNLLNSASA
jgi:hypothetical protein